MQHYNISIPAATRRPQQNTSSSSSATLKAVLPEVAIAQQQQQQQSLPALEAANLGEETTIAADIMSTVCM